MVITKPRSDGIGTDATFVTEARPLTMAEHFVVADLLVRKHLGKYLSCKLNPEFAAKYPFSDQLAEHIARMLSLKVRLVPNLTTDQRGARMKLFMTIAQAGMETDPLVHNNVVRHLEEVYRNEFHSTVDQLHLVMGVSQQDAIDLFRRQYGITEDDLLFRSSERSYQLHKRKLAFSSLIKPGRVGRPRKSLSQLSPRYRQRVMRATPTAE